MAAQHGQQQQQQQQRRQRRRRAVSPLANAGAEWQPGAGGGRLPGIGCSQRRRRRIMKAKI